MSILIKSLVLLSCLGVQGTGVSAQGEASADAVPVSTASPQLSVEPPVADPEGLDPYQTGIELTSVAQRELQRLEKLWLEWMTAWAQNDPEHARIVVDSLLSTTHELGFESLPDLSLGALVKALRVAGSGDFERADWALHTADQLDPLRPETAFAYASVERSRGDRLKAIGWDFKGLWRYLRSPQHRRLGALNLVLWFLWVTMAAAALFVAVEMATHGGGVIRDAVRFADRLAPRWLAYVLAIVGLLWPLLLPYGLLWLLLYWSVLLWGYGSFSERATLVALWALVAVAPWILTQCNRRATVELLPPIKAVEHLREHRLYGGLFTDLGVLGAMEPESVPVKHLLADVHRMLGQWELAQPLYREVLTAEPANASILVNFGAFHFLQGDYTSAIEAFQKGVDADPGNAAALYNLSQAYNEGFLYSESRAMLDRAAAIDEGRVTDWLKRAGPDRVLAFNGGLVRGGEIRQTLLSHRGSAEAETDSIALKRQFLTPLLFVVLLAAAAGLHLVRRQYGYSDLPEWASESSGTGERLMRTLVPGLDSAQQGHGVRAYLAWLPPLGLLFIPMGRRWFYRLPWGFDSGQSLPWLIALVGLALLLLVRWLLELRTEEAP